MNDKEQELKILLTKEQADTLLRQHHFLPARIQTNTYYDTKEQTLRKAGMALRIRTILPDPSDPQAEAVYILTIKKPLNRTTKYEYEQEIHTNRLKDLTLEQKAWIQDHLDLSEPLEPVATFQTERAICNLPDAEYSIDHTTFAGHDDYEAEYEYRTDHDGISAFNSLLKPAGLAWEENGPSKIARAMMDQDKENL